MPRSQPCVSGSARRTNPESERIVMPRAAAPRPELLGLLAACKERPDEDGPRLVLADWLEENGESDRAAFVRAQVRRANEIGYEQASSTDLVPIEESNVF